MPELLDADAPFKQARIAATMTLEALMANM
jgi:hypothetical protein